MPTIPSASNMEAAQRASFHLLLACELMAQWVHLMSEAQVLSGIWLQFNINSGYMRIPPNMEKIFTGR